MDILKVREDPNVSDSRPCTVFDGPSDFSPNVGTPPFFAMGLTNATGQTRLPLPVEKCLGVGMQSTEVPMRACCTSITNQLTLIITPSAWSVLASVEYCHNNAAMQVRASRCESRMTKLRSPVSCLQIGSQAILCFPTTCPGAKSRAYHTALPCHDCTTTRYLIPLHPSRRHEYRTGLFLPQLGHE